MMKHMKDFFELFFCVAIITVICIFSTKYSCVDNNFRNDLQIRYDTVITDINCHDTVLIRRDI